MSILDFLFEGKPPQSVTTYGQTVENIPKWMSDYTQGLIARPWDIGMELGASATSNSLIVRIKARENYTGKIIFDVPRYKYYMGVEKDWPRMNTLPEWFTVDFDTTYRITNVGTQKAQTRTGRQLHDGLGLNLQAGESRTLCVEPI